MDTEIKDWEKASEFGNWAVSDDFPRLLPRGGVEAKFADRVVKGGKRWGGRWNSDKQSSFQVILISRIWRTWGIMER